jgi:hypothetical protein
VESPQTQAEARPSADCCPSAPIAVLQTLHVSPPHLANLVSKAWVRWPHHALRLDSSAAPRAPPHSVFA